MPVCTLENPPVKEDGDRRTAAETGFLQRMNSRLDWLSACACRCVCSRGGRDRARSFILIPRPPITNDGVASQSPDVLVSDQGAAAFVAALSDPLLPVRTHCAMQHTYPLYPSSPSRRVGSPGPRIITPAHIESTRPLKWEKYQEATTHNTTTVRNCEKTARGTVVPAVRPVNMSTPCPGANSGRRRESGGACWHVYMQRYCSRCLHSTVDTESDKGPVRRVFTGSAAYCISQHLLFRIRKEKAISCFLTAQTNCYTCFDHAKPWWCCGALEYWREVTGNKSLSATFVACFHYSSVKSEQDTYASLHGSRRIQVKDWNR